MISVLIPARGRPDRLKVCIETLGYNAKKPLDIEYILRTDDDEAPSAPALSHIGEIVELRGPRHGYAGMHLYYNECAAKARGEHMLIWNDDLDMLAPSGSECWDEMLLAESKPGLLQCLHRDIFANPDDSVAFFHRALFDAMGHLSLHCYTDTWLSQVSAAAGLRIFRPGIKFTHHRIADDTSAGREAAVKVEHPKFAEMAALRFEDVEKVKAYVAKMSAA